MGTKQVVCYWSELEVGMVSYIQSESVICHDIIAGFSNIVASFCPRKQEIAQGQYGVFKALFMTMTWLELLKW